MKIVVSGVMAVVIFIFIIPLMFVLGVFHAFVIKCLYDWFVLTIFTELPKLRLAQAYGLGLFVSYFTTHFHPNPNETNEFTKKYGAITFAIMKPIGSLIFGYIVYKVFIGG